MTGQKFEVGGVDAQKWAKERRVVLRNSGLRG